MIRIIAGTVGYKKDGRIVPLTGADGAVDLGDPKLEARLVKNKVAVYETAASAPDGNPPENKPDGSPPLYSKDMKLAELIKIAEAYGVENASAMRTKDAVITAIEAAKAASEENEEEPEGDGDEDGEEQPNLGTADPEGVKT